MPFALADSLTPLEIRKEAGYQPSQLGVSATDNLVEYDAYVRARITARAAEIEAVLDSAAGVYAWPFGEDDTAAFWSKQSVVERVLRADKINLLARDVVRMKVLGDMALRAAKRLGGREYYDEVNALFAQAKEALAALVATIHGAVSGADATASGVSGEQNHVSMSVPIQVSW